MATPLLVVLLGALLLVLSVWGWRGRSVTARWWVGTFYGPQVMLGIVPGLGLLIFCVGLLTLSERVSEGLFGAVALLIALPVLFALVLEFAGLLSFLPRWWAPRWYRQMSDTQKRIGGGDAFGAVMKTLAAQPGVNSAKEVAAKYRDARPVGSWSGGWVFDPDSHERPHGLARNGAIDGHVTLYRSGIVFAASRAEDALRGKGTVLAIEMSDVTAARVVPARAGADGKPRKGVLYRSVFPRLAVSTVSGDYVFDFPWARAKRVAEQLVPLIPDGR